MITFQNQQFVCGSHASYATFGDMHHPRHAKIENPQYSFSHLLGIALASSHTYHFIYGIAHQIQEKNHHLQCLTPIDVESFADANVEQNLSKKCSN